MPHPSQLSVLVDRYNSMFLSLIPSPEQIEIVSVTPVSQRSSYNAIANIKLTKIVRVGNPGDADMGLETKVSYRNVRVFRENLYRILWEATNGFAVNLYLNNYNQPGMLDEVLLYIFQDYNIRLTSDDVFLQHDNGNNYKLVCRALSLGWVGFFPLRIYPV